MKKLLLSAISLAACALSAAGGLPELTDRLSRLTPSIAIASGCVPGALVLVGSQTRPIAFGSVNNLKAPVAAAAQYGEGRVIAVTHHGFFEGDAMDAEGNRELLRASLVWLSGEKTPAEIFYDIRLGKLKASAESVFADRGGVRFTALKSYRELNTLPKDAVVITAPDAHALSEAKLLTRFISSGGRVLAPVVGWGWHQINKKPLSQNPFNVAIGPAGIYTSGALAYGKYVVGETLDGSFVKADEAIQMIKGEAGLSPATAKMCLSAVEMLVSVLPDDDKKWRPEVERLARSAAESSVPSPATPLKQKHVKERLSYMLFLHAWQSKREAVWAASKAAEVYPGLPGKDAVRVERDVEINLSIPRWHGTSLFAGAGEKLTVRIPDGAEKLGLRVRVGTTTCRVVDHDVWMRAPVVDVELALNKRTTTFSSPFGGLVYIVVPEGLKGSVSVCVENACLAPRFVEGVDTPETWARQLRERSVPVAELENADVVLTVPVECVRDLSDPRALLRLWTDIIACDVKLTGLPVKRRFPERICADVQLCVGYMHAGYPIMIPLHSAPHLVNEKTIRTFKVDDVWGFFHEMGHNYQNYDWTFDGAGEVTVNFFSLYCLEKICGRSIRDNHKIGGEWFKKRVEAWYAAGKPFKQWKSDPFLALDFFARLIEKYGWESFEKLFAEYRTLSPEERPKTDLDKRRQWCTRLSRIVGEDLTEEFRFMLVQ